MKPKGIKTFYKGLWFRSRLEATWAAFFDNLGWEWEYEPCDFDGWIPDFLLEGKYFVEIKPFSTEKQWLDSEVPGDIERAGIEFGILCGITPIHRDSDGILAFRCASKELERVEFLTNEECIFACNATCCQDIRIGLQGEWQQAEERIDKQWKAAKNQTQWKRY